MLNQDFVGIHVYGWQGLGPEKAGLKTNLPDHPVIVELQFSFEPLAHESSTLEMGVVVVFDRGTASLFQFARILSLVTMGEWHHLECLSAELRPDNDPEQIILDLEYRVRDNDGAPMNPLRVGMELISMIKKQAGVVWNPLPVPEFHCEVLHYIPGSSESDAGSYVDRETYFTSQLGCRTD